MIDYSKFFENCSHELIHSIHTKYIKNEYTIKVIEDYLFIENGISLGVEIAQREACMIPNKLDKYVIDKCFFMRRYMDDVLILINSRANALNILSNYKHIANSIGIVINNNKTKILKVNKFKYCKWMFLVRNQKVIMYPINDTIYRQRKKTISNVIYI